MVVCRTVLNPADLMLAGMTRLSIHNRLTEWLKDLYKSRKCTVENCPCNPTVKISENCTTWAATLSKLLLNCSCAKVMLPLSARRWSPGCTQCFKCKRWKILCLIEDLTLLRRVVKSWSCAKIVPASHCWLFYTVCMLLCKIEKSYYISKSLSSLV